MNIESWKISYVASIVAGLISNPDWTETHAKSIGELCADEIISCKDFNPEVMDASDEAVKTISGW